MSRKLSKQYNKKQFPRVDVSLFFTGVDSSSQYFKIKSDHSLSKFDLKLFFFDIYGEKFSRVHSKREYRKKKKVFWVKKRKE